MSVCFPREREAVHAAKRELDRAAVLVLAAEVVPPSISPTGRYCIELILDSDAAGVSPELASILAHHGLTLRRVHRGHDCWRTLASA